MEMRPALLPRLLHPSLQLRRVGVFHVKLFQVGRGAEDLQRTRRRQRRQEDGVRLVPGVANGGFVDDLELRRLAARQHLRRRAEGRQVGVEDDVFPPVAEILRREGRAVRPAVTRPQMEREDPVVLDIDGFEDIRFKVEVGVVRDQSGIAVREQDAYVLRPRHQHGHVAAGLAGVRRCRHRTSLNCGSAGRR